MKFWSVIIVLLTLISKSTPIRAQFYTIERDSPIERVSEIDSVDSSLSTEESDMDETDASAVYETQREETIDKRIFSRYSDLLEQRSTICLPLNSISVTSKYGYRPDPFTKQKAFHNGIDLRCKFQDVYAMLPGYVKEVGYGNSGYGNFVVIDHGDIECKYGHLQRIKVTKGEVIEAGRVVGISGSTGKSTGPHLHICISKNGQSVNPLPFIRSISRYIDTLDRRIRLLGLLPNEKSLPLTKQNLLMVMDRYGVHHPRIVLAQSLLETDHFKSRVCREDKNLFGLRRPSNGKYYAFEKWEDSVIAYRDYVQYKYKGGNYYKFLKDIGYAEDRNYIYKVRKIEKLID